MWENAKRCCYTVVEAPTVTSNNNSGGPRAITHTHTHTHTDTHALNSENLESGCQDCKLAQPQHVLNFVVSELCLELVRVVRGPRGALGGSFWRGFCGRQQHCCNNKIETAATSATTTATAVLGSRLLLYSACFFTLVFGSRLFRNETWQLDAT